MTTDRDTSQSVTEVVKHLKLDGQDADMPVVVNMLERYAALLDHIASHVGPNKTAQGDQADFFGYPLQCTYRLHNLRIGGAYPRTCAECGLGPCKAPKSLQHYIGPLRAP